MQQDRKLVNFDGQWNKLEHADEEIWGSKQIAFGVQVGAKTTCRGSHVPQKVKNQLTETSDWLHF
jgi:hypothetical protein